MLPRLGGRDMAIDLAPRTRSCSRGEGIVVSEPSVVAVDTGTGAIHAVGDEAQQMIGRTPATISAVRPLRHGVIADFEVTEQMLRHFMGRVHGSRFAHAGDDVRPVGHHGRRRGGPGRACLAAGARSVHLIEEPLAAAIGAGLAIDEPRANVVVDVVPAPASRRHLLGGIVVSRSLRLGGYDLDETVAAWMRQRHGLAVGETTAERVKLEVRRRRARPHRGRERVRGRDPHQRLPREVAVPASEIRQALEGPVQEVVHEVKAALEETPPGSPTCRTAASCSPAVPCCAASRSGSRETNVPVGLADSPLTCVAEGAGCTPSTRWSCWSARLW